MGEEERVIGALRASAQSLINSGPITIAHASTTWSANGANNSNNTSSNSSSNGPKAATNQSSAVSNIHVKKTAYARPGAPSNANAIPQGHTHTPQQPQTPLPPPPPPTPAATASHAFMQLLSLSRLALAQSRAAKQETSDAKAALDAAALHERNLLYERDHLRREIANMRAFDSIYQDIPLMSLSQYRAADSISYRDESSDMLIDSDMNSSSEFDTQNDIDHDPLNDNAHASMLKRLEAEYQERKRLKADEDALISVRERIVKENEEKRVQLESLDKELELLLQATLPLQDRLGMPITRTRQQASDAQFLSRPLFVLYQEILNYNSLARDDDQIEFDIVGRENSMEMDVDEASGENGLAKQKKSDSSSNHNAKHEISVKCTFKAFGSSSNCRVTLQFFYLPRLDTVIVATPILTSPPAQPIHCVKNAFSLACLFQSGDTGLELGSSEKSGEKTRHSQSLKANSNEETENRANASEKDLQGASGLNMSSLFNPKEAGGYAYTWVQSLCGKNQQDANGGSFGPAESVDNLEMVGSNGDGVVDGLEAPKLNGGASSNDRNESSRNIAGPFGRVVAAVRKRLDSLWDISDNLGSLFVPGRKLPVAVGQRKDRGTGRVFGWKDVIDEENQNCIDGLVSIECKNTTFVFKCELGWNYPDVGAKFSFIEQKTSMGEVIGEASDEMNELCQLVNSRTETLFGLFADSRPSLLAVYQLTNLVACLECHVLGDMELSGLF
ncbi:THO complex subunit 5 [Chytriomyces hyalinus]|nr:THO complex subunit 5 [Chytriomyces hyalinus]